jgi:flagellar protein FliO/FliZ
MDSTLGTALSGLLGTVLALGIVLGLAYVSLRLLRRWQERGFARDVNEPERRLRFVRALPLGQRERLVLVEAEGELMLIGVSAGSVSLLRNWGGPSPAPPGVAPLPDTTPIS